MNTNNERSFDVGRLALWAVVVPFVGIPLLVVWIVAVAVVLSTLGGIYRTALYLYASTGQAPQGFDQNQMASSFRSKVKA